MKHHRSTRRPRNLSHRERARRYLELAEILQTDLKALAQVNAARSLVQKFHDQDSASVCAEGLESAHRCSPRPRRSFRRALCFRSRIQECLPSVLEYMEKEHRS